MLKIIAYIVVVVAVMVAAVLAYAATRPDVFAVQRSAIINAPPDRIFPLMNDLHRFATWSPYEKKDPAMRRTYSGALSGKGAAYDWDGDSNVGQGRIAIAESASPSKVVMTLDMIRPITAHNIVEFTLEPQGATTKVTWQMHGGVPYLAKIMHMIFDVDRMVGGDFEAGLASLKALAET